MVPDDKYYISKWKKIVNVLKNSNLKISGVAKAGSRARQQHRSDSDIDIIMCASKDPSKKEFYPKLIDVLKGNFPYDKVYAGSTYNVVHFDTKAEGKFDLVLLTEKEFDTQHGNDVEFRRKNL